MDIDSLLNRINIPSELVKPDQIKRKGLFECSSCHRIKKIYQVKNVLCRTCYDRTHVNKDKLKIRINKWKEKNPNYFKEYYKKWKK